MAIPQDMKPKVQEPVHSDKRFTQMTDVYPVCISIQTFKPDKQFIGPFGIVHSGPLSTSTVRLASSPSAASCRMTWDREIPESSAIASYRLVSFPDVSRACGRTRIGLCPDSFAPGRSMSTATGRGGRLWAFRSSSPFSGPSARPRIGVWACAAPQAPPPRAAGSPAPG